MLSGMVERKNNLKGYPQKTLVRIFRIYLRAGVVCILGNLKYLQLAML